MNGVQKMNTVIQVRSNYRNKLFKVESGVDLFTFLAI